MIFRKSSLERLSSPEQLDELMHVTSPTGWLALSAIGVLLLAALAWSVSGSIPSVVSGEGILLRRGGVLDVVATVDGQIESLVIGTGETVSRGQVVAEVRQQGLSRQLQQAEETLETLHAEHRRTLAEVARQRQLRRRELAQESANLERRIQALVTDEELLTDRIEVQTGLLTDGLVTRQALIESQQSLNQVRHQIANTRLELSGLELRELEADQTLDARVEGAERAIRDHREQLDELRAQLSENIEIVSPYSGRVIELMANPGDLVTPGTPVMTLELVSRELMALIYVPASLGKQIEPGMPVQISPSTVKVEEFGYMLGEVSWVAEFPSTDRGMLRLLANEALVQRLMQAGPPLQVNVDLLEDESTPTGYRWSSSGPAVRISSGTLAQGNVIVREDRPIRLVIPEVRKALGI